MLDPRGLQEGMFRMNPVQGEPVTDREAIRLTALVGAAG